jgi:hypothetical protein
MCHVTTATKTLKDDSLTLNAFNGHSVTKTATPPLGSTNCLLLNSTHIEVLENQPSQSGFTQQDIENHTPNASRTSRLEGMQESVMRKAHTHLKSGAHSVRHSIMFALIVRNLNRSQKTTSFLYRKMEAIIYRTFNHCVALAIAGSGRNFNIYDNPDLLPTHPTSEIRD